MRPLDFMGGCIIQKIKGIPQHLGATRATRVLGWRGCSLWLLRSAAGVSPDFLAVSIYAGRGAQYQAKRDEEMQAVADALALLANILMAWNTARMQRALDRWRHEGRVVSPEFIARIAPTRTEGINLRGVFRFPIELYADQLIPRASRARAAES
jgi:hypothetical protein